MKHTDDVADLQPVVLWKVQISRSQEQIIGKHDKGFRNENQ